MDITANIHLSAVSACMDLSQLFGLFITSLMTLGWVEGHRISVPTDVASDYLFPSDTLIFLPHLSIFYVHSTPVALLQVSSALSV